MTILTEYRKQRIARDRDKFHSAIIIALSVIGIFAVIIIAAVENRLNARNEVIYENLKSCPKSSVVDFRQGKPFVMVKGKKIMIAREGC
ncbi:MAG: hypothetical protein PHS33_07575 [Candidatus Omnitrophica bacterium]|nr:hypothetical protein [Candidatus Omnitrophota bacterium]